VYLWECMKLCHLCKLSLNDSKSILEFPFKLYSSKQSMLIDLYSNISNIQDYLFTLNPDYNSNIVHEICYYLSRSTFINKKFRKQYIWALEILSTLSEFSFLCNSRNDKGEVPLECFIRKSEDRGYKTYEYIKNLLRRYTVGPINTIEPKKVILDPVVAEITQKYHKFQSKLFDYFEEHYSHCITRCDMCQIIIDMFDDLECIGKAIKTDDNRDIIRLTIQHIIILRNSCTQLCEDGTINGRHKHIITYFDRLLREMN
jgi:hypothetical protein